MSVTDKPEPPNWPDLLRRALQALLEEIAGAQVPEGMTNNRLRDLAMHMQARRSLGMPDPDSAEVHREATKVFGSIQFWEEGLRGCLASAIEGLALSDDAIDRSCAQVEAAGGDPFCERDILHGRAHECRRIAALVRTDWWPFSPGPEPKKDEPTP